ncbi:unnamed protein product, partial [Amoebophrya sp. A120]
VVRLARGQTVSFEESDEEYYPYFTIFALQILVIDSIQHSFVLVRD